MAETAVLEEPQETKKPPKRKTKPVKAKATPEPEAKEPKADRVPKTLTFMERVGRIAKADWGTRAHIKLYRLEPIIDRVRTGDPKMVDKYSEPIDEERIMVDQGSGRYRLYLTYKAPAAGEGKELDSTELEILNTAYPPKISLGQWIDDPKNKKWSWAKAALEKAEKAAAGPVEQPRSGTSDVLETMQVLTSIRKSVSDELKPTAQPNPFTQIAETIKAVRELTPAPAPPPPPATENKMLDVVMTLLTKQIDSQAAEIKELRESMHKGTQTNGLGTMKETITALGDLLPKVKELFPNLSESVGRSRMPAWMEFVQPAIGPIGEAFKPLAAVLAQKIMMGGQQLGQQQPQPLGGHSPQPAPTQIPGAQPPPPPGVTKMLNFLNTISPAMFRHLAELEKGGDQDVWGGKGFASSVDDLYGEKYEDDFDWLTEAKTAGVENIIGAYRTSRLWPRLQPQEQRFRQFVTDFVSWTRPTEEGDEEETDVDLSNPAMVN